MEGGCRNLIGITRKRSTSVKKNRALAGKINNINHINAGASLPTVATLCVNVTNNVMPQT